MSDSIGLISHLCAAAAFGLLTLLLVLSWRGKPIGRMVILATACTAVWGLLIFLHQLHWIEISIQLVWLSEFLRDASWCLFLLRVGATASLAAKDHSRDRAGHFLVGIVLSSAFVAVFLLPAAVQGEGDYIALMMDIRLVALVLVPVCGLLLVEQIYRSAGAEEKWILRYLCLGVGALFAYDFFLYSDALLFKAVNESLWQARGIVNSLSAPLIAISIARNPAYDIAIHVSRKVVFHSVTVLGAGLYLLVMSGAGFLIQYYGGAWGGVLQVIFFCAAGLFLLVVLFSDKIRAKTRVFLSKHFYSFKYDYREEWLKFTKALTETDDIVPARVIRGIASLVNSDGGLLWQKGKGDRFFLLAQWNMANPESQNSQRLSSLVNFLEAHRWVVDLDEFRDCPDHYEGLDLPSWFLAIPDTRLIVPLVFKNEMQAFILLRRSAVREEFNWEDRDLLKMAGQQAATYLAQYLADKALVEARQFDAFNRLSAYIVHDLKNILAQQSLIVANAGKHRDKPQFMDDVIKTVENSVVRMTKLMEQLRSGVRGDSVTELNLVDLLRSVVAKRSTALPAPELIVGPDFAEVAVRGDLDQLVNVFGQIIQNAQEATPRDGCIRVILKIIDGQAYVEVHDTGVGMDETFIRNRLFKPFESTKGLTGMGVGLFESREIIRSLGGDITVKSMPGRGTMFVISLPVIRVEPASGGAIANAGEV